MKKVSILGLGRFGGLWARILARDFEVKVYDKKDLEEKAEDLGASWVDFEKLFDVDTLFLCVPISSFPEVTKNIAARLKGGTLVVDVASVKKFPAGEMVKNLPEDVEIMNTHPMFGPDSAKGGLEGLPIVMHKTRVSSEKYDFWKKYFSDLGLEVVEMSPEEHDREAAFSQGITHYVGRVLGELDLKSTPIGTLGYEKLLEIVEQTCNDTWELFRDLQTFNPFTKKMRVEVGKAQNRIFNKLLPERVDPGYLTVGIQGGEGSFNEQALREYCEGEKIKNVKTKYLFTSKRVLDELYKGEIDRGQFAVENAAGGVVQETIEALSGYRCRIVDQFKIIIDHCLMVHPEVEKKDINAIISHPQALAQCRKTLEQKYPGVEKISGEGDLIDQANCARALSRGELPKNYAVLAAEVCADKFNLEIIDRSLQDLKENYTSFLWVKRPEVD